VRDKVLFLLLGTNVDDPEIIGHSEV